MVPGGSRESLPKRKVRVADDPETVPLLARIEVPAQRSRRNPVTSQTCRYQWALPRLRAVRASERQSRTAMHRPSRRFYLLDGPELPKLLLSTKNRAPAVSFPAKPP